MTQRLILILLVLALVGCMSPGDQYQASSIAFVAAVDTAASLREAGHLQEDEIQVIDQAIVQGHAFLHEWAQALKEGRDYPEGVEKIEKVIHKIRKYFKKE